MNIDQLLSELQTERNRISIAIDALTQLDRSAPAKRRGRPPASFLPAPKKRTMSKAARAKIAAAQRARWAKQRRTAK